MFNPLGALSAFGGGVVKGATEDAPKIYDMMGMQALGRAFQQMQGPIDQMNAQRGMPQPPMPGQPSSPAQPAGGPPMPPGPMQAPGGPPPMASGPPPAGFSVPAGGPPSQGGMMPGGGQMIGGGPGGPPMGGGMPQTPMGGGQGGMPQFDLQTLVTRINSANPGLPPQALVAALTKAAPLLNIQGKQELALLRQQMQQQTLDLRRDALDVRASQGDRSLDLRERAQKAREEQSQGTGMTPDAIEMGAERYLKTGSLPSLGWGSQARAAKAALLNRAAEMAQEKGESTTKILKDQQVFKSEQVAIQRFQSGPQGNTIRSLGVVVDHLSTMKDLAGALENGNTPLFNRIAQAWAEQTGQPAPTNFDTAKQIVGSEIIKALGVAGAGTAEERKSAADAFMRARSPDQINGAITVAQRLLGGQLNGLRRQFVQSTGLKGDAFDEMIGSQAKQFLEGGAGAASEGSGGSSGDSFGDRFKGGSAPKVDLGGGWSAQRVK